MAGEGGLSGSLLLPWSALWPENMRSWQSADQGSQKQRSPDTNIETEQQAPPTHHRLQGAASRESQIQLKGKSLRCSNTNVRACLFRHSIIIPKFIQRYSGSSITAPNDSNKKMYTTHTYGHSRTCSITSAKSSPSNLFL